MKKLKSYVQFTPALYKLVFFFIIPLACVVCQWIGCSIFHASMPFAFGMMLVTSEVVGDFFVFGGIYGKDFGGMDYLKTSPKGIKVFCDALTGHMIRTLISTAVVYLIAFGIIVGTGVCEYEGMSLKEQVSDLLAFYICGYAVITLFQFLSRFFDQLMIGFLLCYASSMAYALAIVLIYLLPKNTMLIIGAVASIVFSVIQIKYAMKKVKGSYYDKTV